MILELFQDSRDAMAAMLAAPRRRAIELLGQRLTLAAFTFFGSWGSERTDFA